MWCNRGIWYVKSLRSIKCWFNRLDVSWSIQTVFISIICSQYFKVSRAFFSCSFYVPFFLGVLSLSAHKSPCVWWYAVCHSTCIHGGQISLPSLQETFESVFHLHLYWWRDFWMVGFINTLDCFLRWVFFDFVSNMRFIHFICYGYYRAYHIVHLNILLLFELLFELLFWDYYLNYYLLYYWSL
jgi:hypothetical protein